MSRFTIELAEEIDEDLSRSAAIMGVSRGEALKRALALIKIAIEERELGNEIGIIKCDKTGAKVVGRIKGV
jgi:hypothetical protein